MITFSLTFTCIIRNIKEKVKLARTYETSIVGIIATAIGLSALQVCGVGAPVCGATVGVGIASVFMPSASTLFLEEYAIWIIIASITFQIIALYFMNCFKKILK